MLKIISDNNRLNLFYIIILCYSLILVAVGLYYLMEWMNGRYNENPLVLLALILNNSIVLILSWVYERLRRKKDSRLPN